MELLTFSAEEFAYFRALQIVRRWDWPAVFSTNWLGHIWPFVRYSWTPFDEREDVRGLWPGLDHVADLLRHERNEGGRFFISETGAFYKDESAEKIQFAEFHIRPKPTA